MLEKRIKESIIRSADPSPVLVGGSVIYTISFTSIRIYCDWPDDLVARLRLVGEIFAAAVERKRADAERKRTEEALRSGQERYRKLSENFPNGAVITYDTDLRVTFIAGRGLHEAGFSPDFFIGKTARRDCAAGSSGHSGTTFPRRLWRPN